MTLVFDSKFNQSLAAVSLPESLETLTFSFDFRQSLEGVTLPSGLLSLTFGSQFNQSSTDVALPSGLQTLKFGDNFNQSLEGWNPWVFLGIRIRKPSFWYLSMGKIVNHVVLEFAILR